MSEGTNVVGQPVQQPPPPKKKHTFRNVMLVLLLICGLGFAGCAALIGSAADSVDKAIKEEEANDKPTEVAEGEAFEHDIWSVKAGWSIEGDGLGGATVKGLRAENIGDDPDHSMLIISMNRGDEVLASIDCTSDQAQPGQTIGLTCLSADNMPKRWQTVTVRDSW